MCSDPQVTPNGICACRNCDECVASRRWQWVARAMMEKHTSPHCVIVALTYDEETQENRDAARMFRYKDVSDFLGRVRAALRYQQRRRGTNDRVWLRFIAAGEQGDRNGRCHWHLILYSSHPLTAVGEIRDKYRVVTDPSLMWSTLEKERRLHWSLWGKGFVTLQEPDVGGFHYVLSYALKDQFTVQKSVRAARIATAENFATGLFRQSRQPGIGHQWMGDRLSRYLARGAVPPSLDITVPDLGGYLHPFGIFRKFYLRRLHDLNEQIKEATGAEAPQWQVLRSTLSTSPYCLAVLDGEKSEAEEWDEFLDAERLVLRVKGAERERQQRRETCERERPCYLCSSGLSYQELEALGLELVPALGGGQRLVVAGTDAFDAGKVVGKAHPRCWRYGQTVDGAPLA